MRGTENFTKIYNEGTRYQLSHINIYIRKGSRRKAAFVVDKKTGKAAMRNRCRRLLREAYRNNKERFDKCDEIIFVVRRGCINLTNQQIDEDLKFFFNKRRLQNQPEDMG